MQVPDSLHQLIQKYLDGNASAEEEKTVNDWYHSFTETQVEVDALEGVDETVIASRIKGKLLSNLPETATIKPLSRWWLRSAAAIIFIVLSTGIYVYFSGKKDVAVTEIAKQSVPLKNDIVPGGNKATLTLADGSIITLDSATNGILSHQGNTQIVKLNSGELAYNPEKTNQAMASVLYNTISTPRGGQYQVTLPDATKVWLNASSSIRFPAAFAGTERTVEITGEAYLEVAKNAAMPFNVLVKGAVIKVLGTHFNIMAYDDEINLETTLLEGAVKVSKGAKTLFIKPGQQAYFSNSSSGDGGVTDADMEEAVAWKNGRFQFNSADIKSIMRQIERWYDVEVVFNNNTNLHLSGQITRYANVSEVLRKLELTNEIHFKIEGRKIIVNK